MAGPLVVMASAILIAAIVAIARTTRRTRDGWDQAARRLGIELHPARFLGHPKISGRVGRTNVGVEVVSGRGDGDGARTRFRVEYGPISPDFRLRRRSAARRLMELLGAEDVTIGHQRFDEAFTIQTTAPGPLGLHLTPARRAGLLELLGAHKTLVATNHHLEVTSRNVERSPDVIEATVRTMVATAELQLPAQGGDDAEPFRPQPEMAPRRREVEYAAPSADPPPLAPAPTQDAPSAPPAALISAAEFSDAIFGEHHLSFQTDALFTERFAGRQVRWTGRVKSARRYEADADFGDGPGTKAVMTVAAVESSLYGTAAIDAVADLPAATSPLPNRGDEVTIEGSLDRVDVMTRSIFLRNARVV